MVMCKLEAGKTSISVCGKDGGSAGHELWQVLFVQKDSLCGNSDIAYFVPWDVIFPFADGGLCLRMQRSCQTAVHWAVIFPYKKENRSFLPLILEWHVWVGGWPSHYILYSGTELDGTFWSYAVA